MPRGWWGAVPGGGGLPPLCGASGVRRCPSPGRPSSGAGSQGSATRVSRVRSVRAWGPSTGPTARALAGRRCSLWGWRKGVPGGGAFHHCEGRLRSGAVPTPTARPLGGPGVCHPRAVGAGVWVWGPNTVPLACMPCGGCVPRGWWGAVPGGGGLPLLCGASGVRRCPSPGRPSSGAGSQGSATRVSRVRSVRAWGPSTGPTARALAGWRCAPWGWRKGVPGGGAVRRCEGRLGSGAPPTPTARPLGGLPGLAGHWLWVLGVQAWRPVTNPTARALACCGGGMRVPGGGASCLGVGRPGSGALPPPTTRPFGLRPGPTTHWLWVRGGAGMGTRHQPHSARSCELALRAVGAARGCPGEAPSAWLWGVRGQALSHPRPPVLSGVRPGPASHWPWVRCAGVGARLSLAPCPVPRFVVCCARFPGSRHPVAVVAWHLSSCRGCGRRRASLACLVAPRWCAAPRPVWSLSVLRSAFPSPWCLPPPRALEILKWIPPTSKLHVGHKKKIPILWV